MIFSRARGSKEAAKKPINRELKYDVEYSVRTHVPCASPLLSLFRLSYYEHSAEKLRKIFADINLSVRSGEPEALSREMLLAYTQSGLQAVPIDGSNTQFIAACLELEEFHYGNEPDIFAAISALMPKDGFFLDVGANWGQIALHVLLDPSFTGRVAAIEPVSKTFRDLRQLVARFGFLDRCQLLQIATGDNRGIAQIPPDAVSGMQSIHGGVAEGEIIRVERLDDLNLPPADFIKIDVENHEAETLRGASAYLASSYPVVMFENWLNADPVRTWEPFRVLDLLGYQFFNPQFKPRCAPSTQLPVAVSGELTLTPLDSLNRADAGQRINALALHRSRLSN